jgi:hypothetical protein
MDVRIYSAGCSSPIPPDARSRIVHSPVHTGHSCGRVQKDITTDPISKSGGEPAPLATPQSLQVSLINADRAIAVMIHPNIR